MSRKKHSGLATTGWLQLQTQIVYGYGCLLNIVDNMQKIQKILGRLDEEPLE